MNSKVHKVRNTSYRAAAIFLMVLISACASAPQADAPESEAHRTIVIVHGAWGGGWQFHKVEPLLEARGHTVYRPTLTGLGERVHLANAGVGLTTHIEDIVQLLEFEDLNEVVLVGHSYGGMVITGVADRLPHRIATLIYLDAILPDDGDSVASLFGDAVGSMARRGEGADSWRLIPLWVEEGKKPPVDVPQPMRTFTERIVLGNPEAEDLKGAFLLTVDPEEEVDSFEVFADRARDRGWPVVVMEGGHNPQWFQPEACVDKLLLAVEEARRPSS
jgi:pimeloyl-ACP methyl ester carboxylesterase